MADFDSADLLSRMRLELKRPTNDPAVTTADLYQLLTEGLRDVQGVLATHGLAHNAAWEQATTADNITYTIQYDPVGKIEARDGRNGRRLRIGADSDPATDLVWLGTTFRTPDNTERAYANGLWVFYTKEHPAINASTEPVLTPARARLAAVYRACELWLDRGGYKDIEWVRVKYAKLLFGDPLIPGSGLIPTRKQPFVRGGSAQPWWKSSDFSR